MEALRKDEEEGTERKGAPWREVTRSSDLLISLVRDTFAEVVAPSMGYEFAQIEGLKGLRLYEMERFFKEDCQGKLQTVWQSAW